MVVEEEILQASSIFALCHCGHYDFPNLQREASVRYKVTAHRHLIQIHQNAGYSYIFSYGVVVFWHGDKTAQAELLAFLSDYAFDPIDTPPDDEFSFELNSGHSSVKHDHISLPDDDLMNQLAVSQAIAQSTKLSQFESQTQESITTSSHIPKAIAETGKSGLGRKQLAKMRGYLFLRKSDVMLHYDLLDVPEFFWEYPELQPLYDRMAEYLEIRQRVDVLDKKLETVQNLLQMVADEQMHSHSALLEWIIIWLIAIDIILILVQEAFF